MIWQRKRLSGRMYAWLHDCMTFINHILILSVLSFDDQMPPPIQHAFLTTMQSFKHSAFMIMIELLIV